MPIELPRWPIDHVEFRDVGITQPELKPRITGGLVAAVTVTNRPPQAPAGPDGDASPDTIGARRSAAQLERDPVGLLRGAIVEEREGAGMIDDPRIDAAVMVQIFGREGPDNPGCV